MVAKHAMKKQVMLQLLDCAELVAFVTKTFSTPRPKFFLENLVVPFFCGADLCEV